MMQGVDPNLFSGAAQSGNGMFPADGMNSLRTAVCLFMTDCLRPPGKMLMKCSSKACIDHLKSPADSKYRFILP